MTFQVDLQRVNRLHTAQGSQARGDAHFQLKSVPLNDDDSTGTRFRSLLHCLLELRENEVCFCFFFFFLFLKQLLY